MLDAEKRKEDELFFNETCFNIDANGWYKFLRKYMSRMVGRFTTQDTLGRNLPK